MWRRMPIVGERHQHYLLSREPAVSAVPLTIPVGVCCVKCH